MNSTSANQWKKKAADLDRYRWLLLRERHGSLGSALRFIRDAIIDLWFGLYAKRRLEANTEPTPCDFLLLQSAPKIIGLNRKKQLITEIRRRGHCLTEIALPTKGDICVHQQLMRPPATTPLRYFSYAAHATWIVEKYQPRVLLNDRNGSLYSPFLRLTLNRKQALLVHLAHATTGEGSRRLSMNDYDYYFLFGPSSLAALQARSLRFGTSTVVLAGSHMVDVSYDLPSVQIQSRTVLVLGVGPDREKEVGYQKTYALLRAWAGENPSYRLLFKRHPRSSAAFWNETVKTLQNVIVLPPELSLAQALMQSSIVINIMSNAVVEAGLAGRPVIYCNLSEDLDIFNQEQFFGKVAVSAEQLQSRIENIERRLPEHAELARSFAHFHLAHGLKGLEKTLLAMECLLNGSNIPSDIEARELTENLTALPTLPH